MIKVERTFPAPVSLSKKDRYDEEDVVNQLKHDFYEKCYICGIKPVQDPQIEHFLPHKNGKYIDRKYDWNNLFFSCTHCNSIKNQTKYDEGLLNCCDKDPEQYIDFIVEGEDVHAKAKDSKDSEAVLTAELVDEVFNKKNTGMRIHKCQVRVDELLKEMNALFDTLDKYKGDHSSMIIKLTLKGLLDRKSPFAEFKRHYIKTHYSSSHILKLMNE